MEYDFVHLFFGATPLNIMPLNIMTLRIKGLFTTPSIRDRRHKRHSITTIYYYAECRVLFVAMFNVVMLSVVEPYFSHLVKFS